MNRESALRVLRAHLSEWPSRSQEAFDALEGSGFGWARIHGGLGSVSCVECDGHEFSLSDWQVACMSHCTDCGTPDEIHRHDCATHERDPAPRTSSLHCDDTSTTCVGCGSVEGQYHAPECPLVNAFTAGRIRTSKESLQVAADTGAHYRHVYKGIKLDPYRVCRIYGMTGGPREHATKKLLRGTSKGGSDRQLIAEVRDALSRWEEMLDEDGK